jgi:hypothetical protein
LSLAGEGDEMSVNLNDSVYRDTKYTKVAEAFQAALLREHGADELGGALNLLEEVAYRIGEITGHRDPSRFAHEARQSVVAQISYPEVIR